MATETLAQRIIRHEGFTHIPKPDSKGEWVIGYGHDITPEQAHDYANGISEHDALDLLNADIASAETETAKEFPWSNKLSPTRLGVLVEMVFQMGADGVCKFHDFLFHLNNANWSGAAHDMIDSEWHKETPNRCEELANLILNDDQVDDMLPWQHAEF